MQVKKTNILGFLSTGMIGLITGLTISQANINSLFIKEVGANESHPIIQNVDTNSDMNKFSQDFINVSKNVTPSIVTIYSTKIVRNENTIDPDIQNDPFLRQFFGNRNPSFQQQPEESKQQGLGSGVIVSEDGTVLTNNHVISGADSIVVTLSDKRKYKAKVIGTDPKSDVAVIKILNAKNLPVARLGDSSNLSVGEWVLAIGNPLGLSSSVTSGIISAKGRDNVGITDFEDFIQTDAAINPGNSGGALVNLRGEVIGINTAIASKTGGYMGIGFAIPSNMAKKVMGDLISKGHVTRGFLGIQIQNLDDSLAKNLGLKDTTNGIVIGDVSQNSPADIGGLKKYDVIESVNGINVNDAAEFRNIIASNEPNTRIKLGIIRNGNKSEISIRLGELENKLAENN